MKEFQIHYVILGERSSSKSTRDRRQTSYHRAADWRQAVRFAMSAVSAKRRRKFRIESVFARDIDHTSPLGGWDVQICANRVGWLLTDKRERITAPRPQPGAGARLIRRQENNATKTIDS